MFDCYAHGVSISLDTLSPSTRKEYIRTKKLNITTSDVFWDLRYIKFYEYNFDRIYLRLNTLTVQLYISVFYQERYEDCCEWMLIGFRYFLILLTNSFCVSRKTFTYVHTFLTARC